MKTNLAIILAVLWMQTGFSINPLKEYKMRPETFKIKYQELKLKTADQYELNTWIMDPSSERDKNVTVIIAGSDAGNMGFSLPYAYYLLNEGYRVVTFDYRGFGDSTDFKYNPDNVYHSEYVTDFLTVMDWCKKELESKKTGVLAFSMGTIITAVGYSSSNYDFYIAEAFIRSPETIRQRIKELKGKELDLPETAITDEQKIEKLHLPILIFSSITDQITTARDSKEFCQSRRNAKTIEFEGAHLRAAATMGMDNYIREIKIFIDNN